MADFTTDLKTLQKITAKAKKAGKRAKERGGPELTAGQIGQIQLFLAERARNEESEARLQAPLAGAEYWAEQVADGLIDKGFEIHLLRAPQGHVVGLLVKW